MSIRLASIPSERTSRTPSRARRCSYKKPCTTRGMHRAPDFQRIHEMYKIDRELNAFLYKKMQKHPQLIRRYFQVASVMHSNGKYPFLHAQCSALRAPRIFLETLSGNKCNNSYYKYFRVPSLDFHIDRAALMEKIRSSSMEVSSHLVSLSYSFFESSREESANYFLFANSSAAQNGIFKLSEEAVYSSLKARGMHEQRSRIFQVINQFLKDYSKLELGTLYLVGIPKEHLSRYVYDSEAYGKPTGIDVQQIIDRYVLTSDNSKKGDRALQARLMLFKETMNPSSGIQVVDVTDPNECASYLKDNVTPSFEEEPALSFFFPQSSNDEEVEMMQRERIDSEVKSFTKSLLNGDSL